MTQYRVTLIGCGHMGAALAQGWIKANLLSRLEILDPSDIPDSFLTLDYVFHVKQQGSMTFERSDIIVLAVKPQIMDDLFVTLKGGLPDNLPILSVAAGRDIASFQNHLTTNHPIIRAMPNTPAAIGKAITALIGADINDAHRNMADILFSAVGETIWLENESLMDAVTAISGSGPAYVFYMIEALATAGTKLGLSHEHAMQLARQTVTGAAALAENKKDIEAATLRKNVTSPKGTTEAALNILMDGAFQEALDKAVTAARDRGKELSNKNNVLNG